MQVFIQDIGRGPTLSGDLAGPFEAAPFFVSSRSVLPATANQAEAVGLFPLLPSLPFIDDLSGGQNRAGRENIISLSKIRSLRDNFTGVSHPPY